MPVDLQTQLLVAVAYLLGSLPIAVLASRWGAGADIHSLGTGIPGTANVYREVGRVAGAVVAVLDLGKGALAVGLLLAADSGVVGVGAGAVAVVVGHWWPVFARFRGGVGAGPAVGAIIVLAPVGFIVAAPVAGLLLLVTRRAWTAGATTVGGPALVTLLREGVTATTVTLIVLSAMVGLRLLTWREPTSTPPTTDVEDRRAA